MLNDYCFHEIFKNLSLRDLANFKESCRRFATVADMGFYRKTLGSLFFDCQENIDQKPLHWDDKVSEALRMMKLFGRFVNRLTIGCDRLDGTKWSEIFEIINEHCNEKLKSLVLFGDTIGLIKEADVVLIADVLKNVETIQLGPYFDYNDSKEFINILSRCENARSIILASHISTTVHKTIFQKNVNLIALELIGSITDSDFKLIVDNLMNTRLEEFTVGISWLPSSRTVPGGNLSQILRLNHLKRICIHCYHMDINPFLLTVDASKSLNVLSLSGALLDISALVSITRLKVLKIGFDCSFVENLLTSVLVLCGNKNFEHLLLLCYKDAIDEETFLGIVAERKASTAGHCLHLTLSHEIYTESLMAIPSYLLQENKKTIKLIDGDDRNYEYYYLE